MKAWLIYSAKDAEKNEQYIGKYFKGCRERNVDLSLLFAENIAPGITDSELSISCNGQRMDPPDFAICRTVYPLLTRQMEYMGIRVFNNHQVAEICNDKQRTYQYMSSLGIPTVDTTFHRKGSSIAAQNLPKVIKPCGGHGGEGVSLVQNEEELKQKAREMEGDFILQDVAPQSGKDLRVYVIGKQIIAAMLRESEADFRANYSLGGKASVYTLNPDETALIGRITGAFSFGLAGIDFLFDKDNNLLFNEIEDVVGARMLYEHTDIDIAALYLDHILKTIQG